MSQARDALDPILAEIAKLQGHWRQVGYERDGVTEPHDDEAGWQPVTTFSAQTFVVRIADGTIPIEGTFQLDPNTDPKSIDWPRS